MAMSMDEGTPNLLVIDEAFGPSADLYVDVLGVQPNASTGQIQHSYFDRREELFRLLNDIDGDQEQDSITASHRFHAERKLDAVVVAMRILGDSKLRLEYDDMRFERLQKGAAPGGVGRKLSRKSQALQATSASKKTTPRRSQESRAEEDFPAAALEDTPSRQRNSPPRTRLRSGSSGRPSNKENKDAEDGESRRLNFSLDSTPSDEGTDGRKKSKNKVSSKNKSRVVSLSPEQGDMPRHKSRQAKERREEIALEKNQQDKQKAQEHKAWISKEALNTSLDETLDTNVTFDEERTLMTAASQGTLMPFVAEHKFVNQISNEINGTFEDTQSAFEQVFSVFTLRDEDIIAVQGKIDKAKRQIERSLISPTQH
jgi:hypothetical protein